MLLDPDAVLFVAPVPDIPGLRELVGDGVDTGIALAARATVALSALSVTDFLD
jgi:hypothetical protein